MALLDDVARYRGNPSPGGLPLTMVEMLGGKPVPFSNTVPDANTFRDEYYYNSRQNILYKKMDAPAIGCTINAFKVWKAISSW